MSKDLYKVEEMLGIRTCRECGSHLTEYCESLYLFQCKQCAALYDSKMNKFGSRKFELDAKKVIKEKHPDMYELAFTPLWKAILLDAWEQIKKISSNVVHYLSRLI